MMLKIGQYLDNDRKALHTHLRMVGLIMDAPCGYVCCIRELKEVTIPFKESMTIVRHATPGTDDENDDDDENMLASLLNKSQDTVEIPSCINKEETCTDKKTTKRR
ncbi:hypothetical protein BDC45DRAFT_542032 [Circinella umbellata]|nr:hypothetical protein BDC45DRAFT_542032 [Circinella umbellata]